MAIRGDLEGNNRGKVGLAERIAGFVSPISEDGRAMAEVAGQAADTPGAMIRSNTAIRSISNNRFLNFARNAMADGIYADYFRPGVRRVGKGVAKEVTGSAIKQIMMRKGFEVAAKRVFKAGAGL